MSRRRKDTGAGRQLPRLDAMNIIGISELLNPQNVDQTKTGKTVEAEVTGRAVPPAGTKSRVNIDPVSTYEQEMQDLAEELGVDFDGPDEPSATEEALPKAKPIGHGDRSSADRSSADRSSAGHSGAGRSMKLPAAILSLTDSEEESEDGGGGEGEDSGGGGDNSGGGSDNSGGESDNSGGESSGGESSEEDGESGDGESSGDSDGTSSSGEEAGDSGYDGAAAEAALDDLGRKLGIDFSEESFKSSRRVPSIPESRHHGKRANLTAEQEKRRHIESVLGDLREDTHTSFGAQREREQDIKANKIEQISQLRLALEEDGINCESVGNPSAMSSMEEIDSVLRILRLKNDRNRCASLAEEIILGGAEMIETVFDGTRAIPLVGWKPDYTGYHNTVNVKMHRMRFETASVVSGIIEKYNLGPMSRIALELLPSLILYPRQQKRQKSRPGLVDDPNIVGGGKKKRVPDARGAYTSIRTRDQVNREMQRDNEELLNM